MAVGNEVLERQESSFWTETGSGKPVLSGRADNTQEGFRFQRLIPRFGSLSRPGKCNHHPRFPMRTLRVVGFLILILMVAFVTIGFVRPSISVETATVVHRSPFVAFDVLVDAERLPDWMDGFVSMEAVVDRDEQVGNTSILRMVSGTDTLSMRQEIVRFDPAQRFTLQFESDMVDGEIDVQLTAIPEGTELLTVTRFEGNSWLWRSLFFMMRGEMRRTQQEDYDRLAALVNEAETPLVGSWSGQDSQGNEQVFHFRPDGEVRWEAVAGGERFELDGVEWSLDRTTDPMSIDLTRFTSGPLQGMGLYGIIEFTSDDSMRVDLEAAPIGQTQVRPDTFTESTAVVRRMR